MNHAALHLAPLVVLASAMPTAVTIAIAASPAAGRVLARHGGALTCFATGLLLTISLTHLLPEAFEGASSPHAVGITLWLTIIALMAAEIFAGTIKGHAAHQNGDASPARVILPVVLGETMHTFTDGIVIASAFLAREPLGWAIAAGVLFHELPQQLGDYALLTGLGTARYRALRLLTLAGASAAAGALLGLFVLDAASGLLPYALALSAASFLYIGLCELVPRLAHGPSSRSGAARALIALFAGSILALLLGVEH